MSDPIVPYFCHRAKVPVGCHTRQLHTGARPPLEVFSTRVGSTTCTEVSGVLDLSTEARLRAHLGAQIDGGARHLMLDMSLVEFCDAAMVRVLLTTQARLRNVRGQLRVVDCSSCVERLIGITDLGYLLHTARP